MNLVSLLQKIAGTESSTFDEVSPRRQVLASWAPKLGMALLPLGLTAALSNKAKAQSGHTLADTLNYLLTLEMLVSGLYEQGLGTSGLVPNDNRVPLTQMSTNSAAHRDFVKSLVQKVGGVPVSEPAFDYSAGNGLGTGPYADVFMNYPRFLGLLQSFEEMTIRAYQGVLPELMADPSITGSCLQVHSVKGRHAAIIRKIRRERNFSTAKNWITQAQSGIPSNPGESIYAGEDNTMQLGVPVANLVSSDRATEGFDEPLSRAAVEYIIDPFIG